MSYDRYSLADSDRSDAWRLHQQVMNERYDDDLSDITPTEPTDEPLPQGPKPRTLAEIIDEMNFLRVGDRVIDVSHFNAGTGTITSIAPDGAFFGKFDNGSIMWRYTYKMLRRII